MKNTNLIIGKTNTGKTKGILFNEVNNLIEKEENLLIVNNREEYYESFNKKLKEKGYNTYIINLEDTTKSNGFNPLILPYNLYKNGNIDDSIELIKNLCLELFKTEVNSDPFWCNMASDYTTGLILTIFKNAKEEEINFGSIGTILTQSSKGNLFNEYLNSLNIMDNIYVSASATSFAPPETKGSIISVIKQKLNMIFMKENLMNMLSINELDLEKIDNKTAIFIIGNTEIANILINQLNYIIKSKKIEFNIIIDNIDLYTPILSLNNIVDNAAYNNIKLYMATHSEESFNNIYSKNLISKIENVINIDECELKYIDDDINKEYPIINKIEKNYFNFEKFMKNK